VPGGGGNGVAGANGGGGSGGDGSGGDESGGRHSQPLPPYPPAPTVVLERECSGTPPPCASSTHCGARGGAGQSWAQSLEFA
jgi:hypothetical protein